MLAYVPSWDDMRPGDWLRSWDANKIVVLGIQVNDGWNATVYRAIYANASCLRGCRIEQSVFTRGDFDAEPSGWQGFRRGPESDADYEFVLNDLTQAAARG